MFVSIGFLRGDVISKFTSKCSLEVQMTPTVCCSVGLSKADFCYQQREAELFRAADKSVKHQEYLASVGL